VKSIQIVIVLSALITGASLMKFATKTSIASSSVDLATFREEARLDFGERCILHYINETDISDDTSITPRELSRECVCLYRAIESSYQDRPEVTPRIEAALETLYLISAFEDSLNQEYLRNYRTVFRRLNLNEQEAYQSLVDGFGKEVQAHAIRCVLSGAAE